MPVTKELVEQLLADPKQAVCPNCSQTGFYDNRDDPKRKPKAPLFKCKNKDCDTGEGYAFGVFDREIKKLAPEGTPTAQKGPATVKSPPQWSQIRVAYAECVALALKAGENIGAKGMPVVTENITVMANSLMMTREKVGCWPALGAKSSDEAKAKPVAVLAQPAPRDDDPYKHATRDDGAYNRDDDDMSLPF